MTYMKPVKTRAACCVICMKQESSSKRFCSESLMRIFDAICVAFFYLVAPRLAAPRERCTRKCYPPRVLPPERCPCAALVLAVEVEQATLDRAPGIALRPVTYTIK